MCDTNILKCWASHWKKLKKRIQEEEKPYACTICHRKFDSPRGRNTHLRVSHGIKVEYRI